MSRVSSGLHHVTAISGPAQRNVDFYVGTLGLRLVKKTVNFDDPGTYHLFYGDYLGRPGTIMTFFPWSGAYRGRAGSGMTAATAFSIPASSLGVWQQRLTDLGVAVKAPTERFGEQVLGLPTRTASSSSSSPTAAPSRQRGGGPDRSRPNTRSVAFTGSRWTSPVRS